MNRTLLAFVLALAATPPAVGDDPDLAGMVAGASRSIVVVSYQLRFDEGDAPYGGGWSYVCPSCGNRHWQHELGDFVDEERTADQAGFLIGPTRVVTIDPLIPSRFIESITVAHGPQSVAGKLAAAAAHEAAVAIELDQALAGTAPLSFVGGEPAFAVRSQHANGSWTTTVDRIRPGVTSRGPADLFRTAPAGALLLNETAGAVGVTFNGELALNGWVGDPGAWTWLNRLEIEAMRARADAAAAKSVLHAMLRFRSPPKDEIDPYDNYPNESETERHVPAILLADGLVLVTASLDKKQTARLEQIRLRDASGAWQDAEFAGSLKDYGALLARVAEPGASTATALGEELWALRYQLLPALQFTLQGEQDKRRMVLNRIGSFDLGFRDQVFPELSGPDENIFLLSTDGRLLAFPLARRLKVTEEDDWYEADPVLTPLAHLGGVLADPPAHIDATNVPLTESEAWRIAWLGVETQMLNPELARAMSVADKTNDGESGLLVTLVYDQSPAARAGVEVGDVLLRIHSEKLPRPVELTGSGHEFRYYDEGGFPWDQLDELPEEYYDQIPPPWPPVDNVLNRQLDELGAGTAFTLEYLREGAAIRADLTVEYSPDHYRSAKRQTHDGLGLTACDMTYEVRRYFQQSAEDPGVTISSLEPGSRASVSGLRPYEIITHVNGEPVLTADDFLRLTTDQPQVRLLVRRMMRERIVRIDLER